MLSLTIFEQQSGSTGGSAFDATGSIGKQFTKEGAIGGTAQMIGGPLAEEGAIGKQFTTQGAVGGTAANVLGSKGQEEKK